MEACPTSKPMAAFEQRFVFLFLIVRYSGVLACSFGMISLFAWRGFYHNKKEGWAAGDGEGGYEMAGSCMETNKHRITMDAFGTSSSLAAIVNEARVRE